MRHPRAIDVDDPRLADFVALNDPARRREVERRGGYFVVEGVLAIERLIDLGTWQTRTIVVLPRVAERLGARLDATGGDVVVADEAVLRSVVGFDLHRGALASVDRRPPVDLASLLRTATTDLVVAVEGVNDHENLGAIYRNAAAFGCSGVVLDDGTADPFYRRSIRVSLGHVLAVPTARVPAGGAGVESLRALGATTLALSPSGSVPLGSVRATDLGTGPVAVLIGSEGPGLSSGALAAADLVASIPMAAGVDSLNVATALAVALYAVQALR